MLSGKVFGQVCSKQARGGFCPCQTPNPSPLSLHYILEEHHQHQMSLAHQYAERAFQSRLSQGVWARKAGHSKMLGIF